MELKGSILETSVIALQQYTKKKKSLLLLYIRLMSEISTFKDYLDTALRAVLGPLP
jgi:hypothetical protein